MLIGAGRLVDHLSLRWMVTFVLIGAAVGSAALGVAPGVPELVIGFFLLRFFGQGLMTHTAQTAVARAFDRHRGKAIRVVAQAPMIFSTAAAPVTVGLLLDFHWSMEAVALLLAA